LVTEDAKKEKKKKEEEKKHNEGLGAEKRQAND
jgi:hypothetical protein